MQRAVRRFMPGETMEAALIAAAPLQAAGIGTMYTRLGENLTSLAEADDVAAHYLDLLDEIAARGINGEISVKPTQLGLDLDEDRAPRAPGPARGARGRRWLVPLDRHGGQRLHRGDPPPLRAAAGRPAADRHLPAGLPQADGRRHRAAAAARSGDPPGQGRLRRAGGDRLPRQAPGRRELPGAGGLVPARTAAAGRSGSAWGPTTSS